MSAKTLQKEESHQAILESAARLLRERGIRASSVAEVMKGAGMTVGGFYAHFDSKEELFTECLRRTTNERWAQVLASLPGKTGEQKALGILRAYLSKEHRDNPAVGCPLPAATAEVAREGEPYVGALASELDRAFDEYGAMLGKRGRRKVVGLMSLMLGALSLSRATRGTALSDEILESAFELGSATIRAARK